jgi:hypothetical protein
MMADLKNNGKRRPPAPSRKKAKRDREANRKMANLANRLHQQFVDAGKIVEE